MEVRSAAKYNLPVASSQWEENAEFLVKFAELFVGAKQVHRVRLVDSYYFQNIYIILLWVVPLLVTIHTYIQYTTFLLHPEKQITSRLETRRSWDSVAGRLTTLWAEQSRVQILLRQRQ